MHVQWQTDALGPDKVVLLHSPQLNMRAIVVIDNVACGPAIGGLRMSPHVDVTEVQRLARTMTLKAAATGLPHGGAKAGLIADAQMNPIDKEWLLRAFARAIRDLTDYIPGPDLGTNEASMANVHDEIGRAVGLPEVLGGISLDEIGATGYGLAVCAEVAQRYAGFDLAGAKVVIQGFGSVGAHAARFLAQRGAVIVAAADSRGAVENAKGLDVAALLKHKQRGKSVHEFSGGRPIADDKLISIPCDIWLPAAQADVIDAANVGAINAKLLLCGANIPVTDEAEAILHERKVIVVPDFIANAGGLICASVEYRGGTESEAFALIKDKVAANTAEVLGRAHEQNARPRTVADALAHERLHRAMEYRRHGPRPTRRAAQWLDT